MGPDEKGGPKRVSCGYGLLGLCCSACLFGPCRLTPFDQPPATSLCERDRDQVVAHNLLQLSLQEALHALWGLREDLHGKPSPPEVSSLLREAERLLSLSPAKEDSSLFFELFPERTFPGLRAVFGEDRYPPPSLTEVLFNAAEVFQQSSPPVERVLEQALQVSLVALLGKDLRERVAEGRTELVKPSIDLSLSKQVERLPATPVPLAIDWTDLEAAKPSSRPASLCEQKEKFLRNQEGKISILAVQDGRSLFELGRALFSKWRISFAALQPLVLISSRRVTSVLGGLGLGGTIVSFPPLPVHGSRRVEAFLSKGLRQRLGSVYQTPWPDGCLEGQKG